MLDKRCTAELSISPLFTRSFSRWSEDGLYLYDSPHSVLLGSALNIKVPFPSLWLTVTEWMLAFYPVPVIDVGAPPIILGAVAVPPPQPHPDTLRILRRKMTITQSVHKLTLTMYVDWISWTAQLTQDKGQLMSFLISTKTKV